MPGFIHNEPVLNQIVQRMLRAGQPQKIILFGSRARGQAGLESDYDLLVIENSNLPRHRRALAYRRALKDLGYPNGPYDTACFHAQQAIEKALKTLLAMAGEPIPPTHDLDELQRACNAFYSIPDLYAIDLSEITDFAVQLRYDIEFWPERDIAEEALKLAKQVVGIVSAVIT